MSTRKVRLDELLCERELAASLREATALILSGAVLVNGEKVDKAGILVAKEASLQVRTNAHPYVSRGGLKLKAALDHFGVSARDKVVIDVGASTGGFTDCLLQEGAKKVYAVDVGYGQLAWSLRKDPRVVVVERTNIRQFDPTGIIDAPPDMAVIDVSFISLRRVIPPVLNIIKAGGYIIALVKPQFEAPKNRVEKGGVIKDPAVREETIKGIINFCTTKGIKIKGVCPSPISGPAGNWEVFIYGIWEREENGR